VPDNYLTETYVDYFVGTAIRQELCTENATYSTATFLGIAYAATSDIQSALRNSGYTVPTTNTTNEYVKLATVGVWIEMAYSRPAKRLPLPADWETHRARIAATNILSGDAMLDLAVSTSTGIGGVTVSESSTSVSSTDGGRAQVFSRKEMSDY
jgi:hypothetical protein